MRIVAGQWSGRRIGAPKGGGTRPTSDRVREALFSVLDARFPDALAGAVLDPFAGSGALALEALSRGAQRATLIDLDRAAVDAAKVNVASLGAEEATVARTDAFELPRRTSLLDGPYSLLLLDPPYRIERARVAGLLTSLVEAGALRSDVIVVWEHASGEPVEWPEGFEQRVEKSYGDTTITIGGMGGERA